MGIAKAQMFCPQERRLVLAERQTANHILHLLLSIVTLGLWVPVWILLAIFSGPYRCPHCGAKAAASWYPSQIRPDEPTPYVDTSRWSKRDRDAWESNQRRS